ncbi:MAG TPA: hypothetical protein VN640_07270 [Sphingomicrobium sp.]|nr:hypothetical protein [Sphingomicrobium sp.]
MHVLELRVERDGEAARGLDVVPQPLGRKEPALLDQRAIMLDDLAGRFDALGVDRPFGSGSEARGGSA